MSATTLLAEKHSLAPAIQAEVTVDTKALAIPVSAAAVLQKAVALRQQVVPATDKFGKNTFTRIGSSQADANLGAVALLSGITSLPTGFAWVLSRTYEYQGQILANDPMEYSAELASAAQIAFHTGSTIAVCGALGLAAAALAGAFAVNIARKVQQSRQIGKALPLKAIAPLQDAAASTSGVEREVLRLVAADVNNDITARTVRGGKARAALADIINDHDELPTEELATAKVVKMLLDAVYARDGKLKDAIQSEDLATITKSLAALTPDDARAMRGVLVDAIFDENEKPRTKMAAETELALLDTLHDIKVIVERPER